MALIRKSNSNTHSTVEKKQIIKVNPYENPDNVLDLMANICSARTSVDTEVFGVQLEMGSSKKSRG